VETAESAAAWFADLGDVVGEASAQSLVGRLLMEAGEPERAVSLLEAAAHRFYSVGMHAAHADTLATLADARHAPGDADRPRSAAGQREQRHQHAEQDHPAGEGQHRDPRASVGLRWWSERTR
jgi:hypothetical protein